MDLGLLVFLLVLGSVIFDSRKKKRSRNQENPGQQEPTDVTSTKREPYDWSEPSRQSRPGPKSSKTAKKSSKDTMSWEAMEEYYGIKMERKETPVASGQEKPEAKEAILATLPREEKSVDSKSELDERTKILIKIAEENNNKKEPPLPQGKVWEPTQLKPTHKRSQVLPPGGLQAGIKWSLILEPPKARQCRGYRH